MEFNKTTAEAEAHLTHCKSHCNQNRKLCLMNAMMTMTGWSNISSRPWIVAEQEERVGEEGVESLSLPVFLFLAE